MRGPGESLSLAVQIVANIRLALCARPHRTLSILQHALLIGIEAFAWQHALSGVIQMRLELSTIEETLSLALTGEREEAIE